MKENLPKVLVISTNAWKDRGAQHTLSEIFCCWDKSRLAQIYVRGGLPQTAVCDRFLRINENDIIKSVFNKKIKTTMEVENRSGEIDVELAAELEKERKRYSGRKNNYSYVKALAREAVWFFSKWKTKELNEFISDFDPDVIFLPAISTVYMTKIQKYVVNFSNKPVAYYVLDDCYSYSSLKKNPLAFLHRFLKRCQLKGFLKNIKRVFAMSPKAAQLCEDMFSVKSSVLTKAVNFSKLEYKETETKEPLTMVYTGRLVIGREGSLANIAKAVHSINRDGERIKLHIYSSDTPMDRELVSQLYDSVQFMGEVTREETEKLQQSSDIVLFAESLHKKYRKIAKMSFSTKLTDYFASGRCIFAVGGEEIAPIDYLMNEDAAVVVTDYGDIEPALRKLCDNPELVKEYGKKAFECGKRNHDTEVVYPRFIEAVCEVAKSEV